MYLQVSKKLSHRNNYLTMREEQEKAKLELNLAAIVAHATKVAKKAKKKAPQEAMAAAAGNADSNLEDVAPPPNQAAAPVRLQLTPRSCALNSSKASVPNGSARPERCLRTWWLA